MNADADEALPLPEGILPCDKKQDNGEIIYSLTAHALADMERHKWLESEHSGNNVGDSAYADWVDLHWNGWIRSRLLEHLYGWRRWSAFDDGQYGLFRRRTVEHHVETQVLREVAQLLQQGGENLDVVAWAQDTNQDLDAILWLLERIDINAVRHRLLTDHVRMFIPPDNAEAEKA